MKNKAIIAVVLVIVLIAIGAAIYLIVSNKTSDNENSLITYEEALEIARNSDCVNQGTLQDTHIYNPNSKTWWIDLKVENKPLCNPACVVFEETKTAEINWRCTGLIEP